MTRTVTVAICDGAGHVLGALPPFGVATPWWMETAPVVEAVRDRWDAHVVVLRIVATEDRWPPHGGAVTYLAEAVSPLPGDLPLESCSIDVGDDERRAPWARPGGVAALVTWADTALESRRRPRAGPARQARTWNLSCLLELPTAAGPVWLKAVPPFFGHEAAVLALLASDPVAVPAVLAAGHNVALLDGVPGVDRYDAGRGQLIRMVDSLVDLQARWSGRVDELLRAGLPDRRGPALLSGLAALATRDDVRDRLEGGELAAMESLVAGLPEQLAAIESCGVPWTLVHGDFHPGNWRGLSDDDAPLTLIDWGDSAVGHPMIDEVNFQAAVGERGRGLEQQWTRAWRRAVPGCDPERASELIAPFACLERAMLFRMFLDRIEPSEHRYHAHDPEEWIRRALSAQSRG